MIHEVKTILVEFAPYICLTAKTSDLLMNARPKSKDSFYRCQICFAPAVHSNYGVVSCPPCKMFFKRNAQLRQVRPNRIESKFNFSLDRFNFRNNSSVSLMANVKSISTTDTCVRLVGWKNVFSVACKWN